MPEVKIPLTPSMLAQWVAIVVAITFAWAVLDSQGKANTAILQDHEVRIRTIEKDFLVAFGELKSEFSSVKSRLTSIEKAIKQ